MASDLTTCPTCGTSISRNAFTCPRCGEPVQAAKIAPAVVAVGSLVGQAVAVVVGMGATFGAWAIVDTAPEL